jgi:hypothetical protein
VPNGRAAHLHGLAILVPAGAYPISLLLELRELIVQLHHPGGLGAAQPVFTVFCHGCKVLLDVLEVKVGLESWDWHRICGYGGSCRCGCTRLDNEPSACVLEWLEAASGLRQQALAARQRLKQHSCYVCSGACPTVGAAHMMAQ